ncbi:MAG: nucleotidyltransferase family protein [Proteobacteria bacterium]|nr:nucleotidyltransferase family protein [Pseudomonadota bacterium]
METRKDILDKLAVGKEALAGPYKVKRLALFGSWARGDNHPDSDVDVLVEVDPSIGLDFVVLAERLEELLGLPVDLVSHRAVKPKLMESIRPELIYV